MPIKRTMFCQYSICYVVTKRKNHASFDSPSKYSSCVACILILIKGTMFFVPWTVHSLIMRKIILLVIFLRTMFCSCTVKGGHTLGEGAVLWEGGENLCAQMPTFSL
jgi:hypothetical protein